MKKVLQIFEQVESYLSKYLVSLGAQETFKNRMQNYLHNIVNQIQRFTSRLENKTVLTNNQWIIIDDELTTKKVYIFRANGELLISINGDVHKAKFEVLNHGNILIEDNLKSYLFNHGFLDSDALILRKDGSKDFFTLVSHELFSTKVKTQQQLAEYLFLKYLKEETNPLDAKKENPSFKENNKRDKISKKLTSGSNIYLDSNKLQAGIKVFDSQDRRLVDGKYILEESKSIVVIDGKIDSILHLNPHKIKGADSIIIAQKDVNAPEDGDEVFLYNWEKAPDREYRLSWYEKIVVHEGIIIKRKILGI